MRATEQDRARLQREVERLVEQLAAMGARRVILFGSLARGQVSLFSDIDLLALFDSDLSARELTRQVYGAIDATEAVDILAYSVSGFERVRERPFFRHALAEGKVMVEREAVEARVCLESEEEGCAEQPPAGSEPKGGF